MGLSLAIIIIVIYISALLLIFMYSLAQLNLLINYLGYKKQNEEAPKFNLMDPKEIPYVTIQLPIYNEKYVMERLLDNIAQLEYPIPFLKLIVSHISELVDSFLPSISLVAIVTYDSSNVICKYFFPVKRPQKKTNETSSTNRNKHITNPAPN